MGQAPEGDDMTEEADWMALANRMRISAIPDDLRRAIEQETVERSREAVNQCRGAVHSPSGSAPERCAYPEDHDGECEP
jgi:hypothetical protein